MDFHLLPIFVNLSLLVLPVANEQGPVPDERAVLADREPVGGRLEIDPKLGVVFRCASDNATLPVRTIRKVVNAGPPPIVPGTSPAHRLYLWGSESLSGTVQSIDGEVIHLSTSAGERLRVPVYLISRIEHFQGDAVILRDDFEADDAMRRLTGEAGRSSDQAASGQWSLRLGKAGDGVEYRLREPAPSGWFEARFHDSGESESSQQWLCELEFESRFGPRTLQILLGWGTDSYGLATPQGPSLQVQRLGRRKGWNRLGVRFSTDRTTVLLNDAVLTHREVGIGSLRAVRFVVRPGDNAGEAAGDSKAVIGYVDDLQIAATVASAAERQPARDQDDVLLINGDQLFGRIQSATARDVTIAGEYGTQSLPWTQTHRVHFMPRPAPSAGTDGQRVRIRFGAASMPHTPGAENETLEGTVRELTGDSIRLEHSHIGRVRILRGQLREMEFFSAGRWFDIDPRFHHFGVQVVARFQVPHPEGTDQSWKFSLEQVPDRASLVVNVEGMEAMVPGAEFNKRLENDEWRTYAAINGERLDPLGLNHLLPPNSKGAVRLTLPIGPGILKKGENLLRIYQTPQKDDPTSFDDCGIFGIGLELSTAAEGKE